MIIALSGTAVQAKAPYERQNNTFPIAGDRELTVADRILVEANKADFKWKSYLLKLAYCESRFDEYATNMNGGHSLDRGVFQWNKKYHPEISDECAFSVECSTKKTMEAINAGKQSMWMCDKLISS